MKKDDKKSEEEENDEKFWIELNATDSQREALINFFRKEEINDVKNFHIDCSDKFNIGNILIWEEEYVIVSTPFGYMDIFDYKDIKNVQRIGTIHNSITIRDIDNSEQEKKNNSDIVIHDISEVIIDQNILTFIVRDNKGKIQYIRPARVKDKLNYRIIKSDEHFNDFPDEEKLRHIEFSYKFYASYFIMSLLIPLFFGLIIIAEKDEAKKKGKEEEDYVSIIIGFYCIYAFLGIWFKGCVYDIKDDSHTQRTCTIKTMLAGLIVKMIGITYLFIYFCKKNKTGIVFILMLNLIYFIQFLFNYIVHRRQTKFLLRTYWLAFIFYQISRLCILVFFVLSVFVETDHIEIFYYALALCIISAYMYLANYFNTLMNEIVYSNIIQAIFNYPMEWMNLFCVWFRNPKDCIREIDYRCCTCDECCLTIYEYIRAIVLAFIYFMIWFIIYIFGIAVDSVIFR